MVKVGENNRDHNEDAVDELVRLWPLPVAVVGLRSGAFYRAVDSSAIVALTAAGNGPVKPS